MPSANVDSYRIDTWSAIKEAFVSEHIVMSLL